MKVGNNNYNCTQYYFSQVWLYSIKWLKKPSKDLCIIWSCVQHVLCSECCLQSQTSSVQNKSYWKIILMASDTSPSIWGDRNYFRHWNKHFFLPLQYNLLFSACNQSKCLFEYREMCHCSASRKISYSKTFPFATPQDKSGWASLLTVFFLSIQPIISYKPSDKCSVSFLSSPFLHLFSLQTVIGTWITRKALGWEKKHILLCGCLRKRCGSILFMSAHHMCPKRKLALVVETE